jgi:hypothetical protein
MLWQGLSTVAEVAQLLVSTIEVVVLPSSPKMTRGEVYVLAVLFSVVTSILPAVVTAKRRWAHAVCKQPSVPLPPFPRRSWRGHGAAAGINLPRRIASSVAVPRSRERCYWTASAAAERCHWSDSRWWNSCLNTANKLKIFRYILSLLKWTVYQYGF